MDRTKEHSVEPTEFTYEMDDLFSWIDETENILGSSLQPNTLYLEALLEKVKVSSFINLSCIKCFVLHVCLEIQIRSVAFTSEFGCNDLQLLLFLMMMLQSNIFFFKYIFWYEQVVMVRFHTGYSKEKCHLFKQTAYSLYRWM